MSVKHKITLLATLWLIGILFAVNVTVYFAFLRVTTDNERDYLTTRAENLLQEVKFSDAVLGKHMDTLMSYLPDNGMIRLLDEKGHNLRQVQSDDEVAQIDSKIVKLAETEVYHLGEQQVLVARIPIMANSKAVGTLEIAEKLETLNESLGILVSILILTTLGAVGISILGGLWLSKWILRPISGMAQTMNSIERNLVFQPIPIRGGGKDELVALASTFNRMMDRIQESFIRQQQFVSDASHELKTPLTIIEGYARMLQRWGFDDKTKGKEAVEHIYTEAVRMKELTQQLLDLASLDQAFELTPETIELVSFCEDIAEKLRDSYHRKITVESLEKTMPFRADAQQIRQLLLILLDNAIKYSKEAIQIALAKAPLNEKPVGIEISVKDRGIGIPEEELPHVFERFYRVDPSRFRKTGGTGLGLSIAYEIVERHGGTINILSKVKVGTEVVVFLPSH